MACLAALPAGAASPPTDQIELERRNDVLQLTWQDAEDRLQGALSPSLPRVGEPLQLSLHVGSFEGAEFDGPITVTFQQEGTPTRETRTLTRARGAVNWVTELTPTEPGTWQVDVRFRTTRLKVLHTRFGVASAPLPRFLGWGLVGTAALVALALGVRTLLRRDAPSAPPMEPPNEPLGDAGAPGPVEPPGAATPPVDPPGAVSPPGPVDPPGSTAAATPPAADPTSGR